MPEQSNELPVEWNRGDPTRRCTAHKKNGQRCRKWAIRGGTVCTHHGGSAPHVLARARLNIALAADHNRSNMQRLADDADSEQVRLTASSSLLDRAGITAKQSVEVTADPEPWRGLFGDIAQISRGESYAARGLPDPAAPGRQLPATPRRVSAEPVAPGELPVIDAEVVPLADMEAATADAAYANRQAVAAARVRRAPRRRGRQP